jgi:hypothetical protein
LSHLSAGSKKDTPSHTLSSTSQPKKMKRSSRKLAPNLESKTHCFQPNSRGKDIGQMTKEIENDMQTMSLDKYDEEDGKA